MNTYEKIFLASLGLVSISAKEIKKVLKNISSKKPTNKELEEFLSKLTKEGRSRSEEAGKQIKIAVEKILKELDIPTRSELRALEKKIRDAHTKK